MILPLLEGKGGEWTFSPFLEGKTLGSKNRSKNIEKRDPRDTGGVLGFPEAFFPEVRGNTIKGGQMVGPNPWKAQMDKSAFEFPL